MKKIFLKTLGVATLATLSLTACSVGNKNTGKETAKMEETTAKSDTSKDSDSLSVMIPEWAVPSDNLLKEFTDSTGIKVSINQVAWDAIRDKIGIAASGGEASADVVEVDWSWVGEFDSADWLEPLKVDDSLKTEMPTISSFSVGDKVLALPYSNDYRIAYYNTKHFEEAGIGEEPKTYDQIYEAVKTIKEKGIAEHPYPLVLTAEEKASTGLIWTAYTMNDKVFNDDNTLNEESVKAALKFYDKLIKEDLVDPADKTADGMETYRRITTGTASYLTGPTSYIGTVNNAEKSQVVGEVAPINSVLAKLIDDGKIENPGAMLEQAKLIASPFPNGVPVYYNEMSNAIYNAVNGLATGSLDVDSAFTQMDTKIKELIAENK